MVWEAVFFLIVLKIPTVYLACVVWWALRGERSGGEAVSVAAVSDTPPSGPGYGLRSRAARRPSPTRPHDRPVTGGRVARARAVAPQ
jgi:hypothetical protein